MKWQTNGSLRTGTAPCTAHRSSGSPSPLSSCTGGDARVPEEDWSLATQTPLLHFRNLLTASKHAQLLMLAVRSSQYLPTTWWQLQSIQAPRSTSNRHGPRLRLRIRFLSFFKGALLPNSNRMVVDRELNMGAQLEDILSAVIRYLDAWHNLVGTGATQRQLGFPVLLVLPNTY